mgnify:CR=1 FL=1
MNFHFATTRNRDTYIGLGAGYEVYMMNFGKAFTFIFDDERWFDKLIVPILVSLIPIVGPLVGGLLGAGGYKLLIERFLPDEDEAREVGEIPASDPVSRTA